MRVFFGKSAIGCVIALGIIGAPVSVSAQTEDAGADPAETGMSAARLERLDEVADKYIAEGSLPGVVTIVYRNGNLAFASANGFQDLSTRTPMRRDTIFAIASMTKPVIAAAALMLVEEGKLRLDEPVDRLLPELADRMVLVDPAGPLREVRPATRPITVRDLLTYRMGIGEISYSGIAPDSPIGVGFAGLSAPDLTADEYMARLGALPLAYDPGERFMYNTPSAVLGVLVSRASGMPLDRFLETRIFQPLGMNDTGFYVPAEKQARVATIYAPNPEGELMPTGRRAPSALPAFPDATGGLYSTADDYMAFARMLLNKGELNGTRILSRVGVELMTQDTLSEEAPGSFFIYPQFFADAGFGYGLQIQKRQTGYGPSPGSYWWQGSTGVAWTADPEEQLIYVRFIQRVGSYAPFNSDFMTALYAAIED